MICDNCDNSNFLSRKFCHNRSCDFLRISHSATMPMQKSLEWLQARVDELKHGEKQKLAEFMNISRSQLSKALSKNRVLSARELERAVLFFKDAPEAFRTPQRMVPIVGYAGAGPEGTVLFATGDGNFGEIPAPEGASSSAMALEVKGDSMRGMAEDGWIVLYEDKEPPNEDHMGEPCVCFLEDDRVLIKTPYPGRQPGLFDLESVNAPTMRDVAVRYFAFITDIKPRRSAKKFVRYNPDHVIEDVSTDGKRLARSR